MRYVALQGERWDTIAYKVLGDAYRVPELLDANNINPKLSMDGGEVIEVPAVSEEDRSQTSEAVPPWLSS